VQYFSNMRFFVASFRSQQLPFLRVLVVDRWKQMAGFVTVPARMQGSHIMLCVTGGTCWNNQNTKCHDRVSISKVLN
jgi:hypothetical protein